MIISLANMSNMNRKSLSQWLLASGVTEAALAKKVGVTQSAINQIKSGRVTPSPETARKLERITKIPLKRLLYPEAKA